MGHAREPKHIERIHRSPISQERRPMRVRRHILAAHITLPLPSFRSHRRRFPPRGILTLRTPYLALPVSDRVPLFRVLYYFFYQSARFQDALRPAESCAINHEM